MVGELGRDQFADRRLGLAVDVGDRAIVGLVLDVDRPAEVAPYDLGGGVGLGFRLVTIGLFFNLFIPGGTGGDLMKIYYLSSVNRGRRVELATLVLLDRVLGLTAMLSLALLLTLPNLDLLEGHPALQAVAALAAAGVAGLTAVGLLALTQGDRIARMPATRFRAVSYLARSLTALAHFRGRLGSLFAVIGLAMLAQAIVIALFALTARAVLGTDELLVAGFLSGVGFVANALPLTPGGLGVGEAAFDQLFAMSGVAGGALVILGYRIATLPAGALGALFYAVGIREERRVLAVIGNENEIGSSSPASSPASEN